MSARPVLLAGVLSWLLALAVVALGYIGHQEQQQAEAARAALGEEGQR